jgi:hypothetical protein
MPTFHVHLGLPKTGSTTFQNALHLNADRLLPHVLVINRMRFGPQRQGLMRAHAYIRQCYTTGIDLDTLTHHLETALETTLSDITDDRPILITDEGLSGPHPGQFEAHAGVFPALPFALDALAAILPRGKTVFHMVVREHQGWVKSLYNQAVKQTGYADSIETFVSTLPDGLDIPSHIAAIQSAHGDKDIRIHTMENAPLFPGQHILKDCGIDAETLDQFKMPQKVNKSWSKGMLQAMRVINGADIDQHSKNTLRKELGRNRDIFTDP